MRLAWDQASCRIQSPRRPRRAGTDTFRPTYRHLRYQHLPACCATQSKQPGPSLNGSAQEYWHRTCSTIRTDGSPGDAVPVRCSARRSHVPLRPSAGGTFPPAHFFVVTRILVASLGPAVRNPSLDGAAPGAEPEMARCAARLPPDAVEATASRGPGARTCPAQSSRRRCSASSFAALVARSIPLTRSAR